MVPKPGSQHPAKGEGDVQQRKLFVGGLDYDTTDEGLKTFYEKYGEVVDHVVMKQRISGESRGFGFVTFAEAWMLDKAMKDRPHVIDGREVEPKRAVPKEDYGDGGNREAPIAPSKVFVGGIDDTVKEDDLRKHFSQYGEVVSVLIPVNGATGLGRGFAFVEYSDPDVVRRVLEVPEHEVSGRPVNVRRAVARTEPWGGPGQPTPTAAGPEAADPKDTTRLRKLFIGGLDFKTTDPGLKKFYSQWGEIVDAVVMRDPLTKRSRGFGFVTYSEPEMVDAAMKARPHVLDSRVVEPKRAVPKDSMGHNTVSVKKLFVGGVRDDLQEEQLRDYFGQFGQIVLVTIPGDKQTGRTRGFAFIEFTDHDPVDKILMTQHRLNGRYVEVKKALSKAQMLEVEAVQNRAPQSQFIQQQQQQHQQQQQQPPQPWAAGGFSSQQGGFNNQPGGFGNQAFNNQPGGFGNQGFNNQPGGFGNQGFNNQPWGYGNQPGGFGNQGFNNQPGGFGNQGFNNQPGGFGNQGFNNQPGGFGNQAFNNQSGGFGNQPFNNQPGGFGNQPFNNQPGGFNNQPVGFNNQPSGFNNQPGGFNNQPGFNNQGFNNPPGGFNNQGFNSQQGGGFGNQAIGNQQGGFGSQGGFANQQGPFGNQGFGNQRQGFGNQSVGNQQGYGNQGFGNQGSLGNQQSGFGSQKGGAGNTRGGIVSQREGYDGNVGGQKGRPGGPPDLPSAAADSLPFKSATQLQGVEDNRSQGSGVSQPQGPAAGSRFQGAGGNQLQGTAVNQSQGPGGNQFQGPPGNQFQGPPPNQFQGPPGNHLQGPPGSQFQGPPGNQFQGPPGNQFQGPPPNQFQGPPGNQFQGPPGNQFQGPPGNQFQGPTGNQFSGSGGGQFAGQGGVGDQEAPAGRRPGPTRGFSSTVRAAPYSAAGRTPRPGYV